MSNQFKSIRQAMACRPKGTKWVESPWVVFRLMMDRALRTRIRNLAKIFSTAEEPVTPESLVLHLITVGVDAGEKEVSKQAQAEKLVQLAPGGLMGKLKEDEEKHLARDKDIKTGGKK